MTSCDNLWRMTDQKAIWPAHSSDDESKGWVGLVRWLLSDHRRAAWAFAFVVVTLSAVVVIAVYLAPHVGDLASLLGSSLAGGGITFCAGAIAQRRRRGHGPDDQE